MKDIFSFLILINLFTSDVKSQVYWGLPYSNEAINDNSLIILPPFDWDYNGHFLPSGIDQINQLMKFMIKNNEYSYIIKLHTKSWGNEKSNLIISTAQKKQLEDYLNSELVLRELYSVIPLGSSSPIVSNDCINYPEHSQHWFFLHKINERVEITMTKKK